MKKSRNIVAKVKRRLKEEFQGTTESAQAEETSPLLDFTKKTMSTYRPHWHHTALAQALDRVAQGTCRRLMVFMPPQHGKSELCSKYLPAWFLGTHPEKRVILVGYEADFAASLPAKASTSRSNVSSANTRLTSP